MPKIGGKQTILKAIYDRFQAIMESKSLRSPHRCQSKVLLSANVIDSFAELLLSKAATSIASSSDLVSPTPTSARKIKKRRKRLKKLSQRKKNDVVVSYGKELYRVVAEDSLEGRNEKNDYNTTVCELYAKLPPDCKVHMECDSDSDDDYYPGDDACDDTGDDDNYITIFVKDFHEKNKEPHHLSSEEKMIVLNLLQEVANHVTSTKVMYIIFLKINMFTA